jgi:NADH-quinone oxidoreductase subunit E
MSPEISDKAKRRVEDILSRYPRREAALLPVLHCLQKERGFLSPDEEQWAAERLGIKPVKVREVVTFYTMFRRQPAGKYHLQVCSNLSCWLAGGDNLLAYLESRLGIKTGETTADGRFTLSQVECLGGCDEAPCLMVNLDYHTGLDRDKLDRLLGELD